MAAARSAGRAQRARTAVTRDACSRDAARHSRLAGSRDLEDWAGGAYRAVAAAVLEHVAAPLAALRDHLFNTFRQRPAMVTAAEYGTERASLGRMLAAYEADYRRTHGARLLPTMRLPLAGVCSQSWLILGCSSFMQHIAVGMRVVRLHCRFESRMLRVALAGP